MVGMNKFVSYVSDYIYNASISHTTTLLDILGNYSFLKIYLPFISCLVFNRWET